jgi:hypothetical protein
MESEFLHDAGARLRRPIVSIKERVAVGWVISIADMCHHIRIIERDL